MLKGNTIYYILGGLAIWLFSKAGNSTEKMVAKLKQMYEGKYLVFEGAKRTIYIENGIAVSWYGTGISDDKTKEGNVYDVRQTIRLDYVKLIPQWYNVGMKIDG